MELTTQILRAISQIYDVTLDQTQWEGVLENLDHQIGSIGCNVFVADHVNAELTELNVSPLLKPALEYYIAHNHYKDDEAMLQNYHQLIPEQKFSSIKNLYRESNARFGSSLDCRVFEDWISKNLGIKHRYTCPLSYKTHYIDLVTYQFGDLSELELQKSLALAELYLPHLSKVIELTRPFKLLQSRFNAVISVLDRFHLGVAILNSKGSMVLANQAAQDMLDQANGLKLQNGKLVASASAVANNLLQKSIKEIRKLLDGTGNIEAKRIPISRDTKATPYLMDISPIMNREIDLSSQFRGILVIVVDPDHHNIIDVSGLDSLFSFTDAESSVCQLLMAGHSTEEMAEIRNVNPNTIRKQINTLLDKTNTHHRTELVHLTHSINIPVDTLDQSKDN